MYQPALRPDQVTALYYLKKQRRLPMTRLLREAVDLMPDQVREPLRDTGRVQDTLDSLFDVQERLFRWRFPDWDDTEPDDFDYAS